MRGRDLALATVVVLVLLACAACARLAPSAPWAGAGALGAAGLGLLAATGLTGKLNEKMAVNRMETFGGALKRESREMAGGPALFAQLLRSKGNQGALQRSRTFLDKRAKRAGAGGFGAVAVNAMLSGGDDSEVLADLRGKWLKACGQAHKAPDAGRASSRLAEAAKFFNHEKIVAADEKSGYRYLDVGCSEGSITAAVVADLGLKREQAVAVDVVPQPVDNPHFEFKLIDGALLPFDDASFDLITMFMSAHHFADAQRMFAEAARVAKPGARLILREHGTPNAAAPLFYDLVHAYYEVIAGEESTPEEFAARYAKGNFATYRKPNEWSQLLSKAGFTETGRLVINDTFDTVLIRYVRTI